MDKQIVLDRQKKGVFLHKLVYILFFLERILLQVLQADVSLRNTVVIVILISLFMVLEEVSVLNNYFNSILYIQIMRYGQCVLASLLVGFLQIQESSEITVLGLPLLFMIDFFMSMEMVDKDKAISFSALLGLPIIIVIVVKMLGSLEFRWLFMFFDILIVLVILFFEAYFFVDYIDTNDAIIFNQKRKVEEIVEKNAEIMQMQEKIKKTNEQLTLQKVDLLNANKLIHISNQEMVAQAEILHYISMSFDVAKISNQITDAIMTVKQLSFCGVYIKEDVYLNKHANYVIKTTIGQLYQKIKDSLSEIYEEMTKGNVEELTLHGKETSQIHFLHNLNINSVYIKVLATEEESYGLFIIGDSRTNLFQDNMSFYDAIIAQYDIAIHNARIYGEMQQMARKDGLTGINNRIYFNELFQEKIQSITNAQGHLSVALFDIDKFKSVNDTYGHLAGDEVIKRIAVITEQCIDKYNGFVCRYGGEEFVVALPDMKIEAAQTIIEELFEEICSQVVRYNEVEIPISVSVGLTSYPEIAKSPDELLKRADWCMYYAKNNGRHQINVDDGSIQRI